jgi:hypothetical protein
MELTENVVTCLTVATVVTQKMVAVVHIVSVATLVKLAPTKIKNNLN